MIIGHEKIVERLERKLSPAVLLVGPKSVGKSTMVAHVLKHHGVRKADTLWIQKLSAEKSREVLRFASRRPMGNMKVAVIELTGASETSLHMLLKLLEEPPSKAVFILVSHTTPLLTVASRCEIFQFGLLSAKNVEDILMKRFGLSEAAARHTSSGSGGTIAGALAFMDEEAAKAPVLAVIKAVSDGDENLFRKAVSEWDRDKHSMLKRWFHEVLYGRERIFSKAERFGMDNQKSSLFKAYKVISSDVRPRVSVKHGLLPILQRNK